MGHVKQQLPSLKNRLRVPAVGVGGSAVVLSHQANAEHGPWFEAIAEMRRWRAQPEQFEAEDRPDALVLTTALDYAVSQNELAEGDPAPHSIVVSGGGRIAMEWNDGPLTVIIEFTGPGAACYERFKSGKLECSGLLHQNPQNHALEQVLS
jgi:hypothetical protein